MFYVCNNRESHQNLRDCHLTIKLSVVTPYARMMQRTTVLPGDVQLDLCPASIRDNTVHHNYVSLLLDYTIDLAYIICYIIILNSLLIFRSPQYRWTEYRLHERYRQTTDWITTANTRRQIAVFHNTLASWQTDRRKTTDNILWQ